MVSFLFHVVIVKESDLHTKRTGHTEFVDKTLESAKPITLEVPKPAAESDETVDASGSCHSEGTWLEIFIWMLFSCFMAFADFGCITTRQFSSLISYK